MPVAVWHITPSGFIRRPSLTRRLTRQATDWKGTEQTLTGSPGCRQNQNQSTCSGKTFPMTATLWTRRPADNRGKCSRNHWCGAGSFMTASWHYISPLCWYCYSATLCNRLFSLEINLSTWKASSFSVRLSWQTSPLILWRATVFLLLICKLSCTNTVVEHNKNEVSEKWTRAWMSQWCEILCI